MNILKRHHRSVLLLDTSLPVTPPSHVNVVSVRESSWGNNVVIRETHTHTGLEMDVLLCLTHTHTKRTDQVVTQSSAIVIDYR